MYKQFINKKNLRRYTSLIKKINYQYQIISLSSDFDAAKSLTELKNNSLMKNTEKTIKALALAKHAASLSLGMTYYDVQLMGALALIDGAMAEMKTGEGKTFTCSAAVIVNYVLGYSTHVATANDYLAKRDEETLKSFYNSLGIKSGYNIAGMAREEKIEAYKSDVLYSTAQELGFDFLRDNLIYNIKDKIQNVGFEQLKCIIDEADFVLIDEARTPLIISGESNVKDANIYNSIKEIVSKFKRSSFNPNKPHSQFEAKEIDGDIVLDEKQISAYFTDKGYEKLEHACKEYQISDLNYSLYDAQNSWLINEAINAVKAKYLYVKDKDYIVKDGSIVIIDTNTGRISDGRTWSNGLHQAIEAKENLNINPENSTLGSISIQNYFRNYKQISGMSGTILQSSDEFEEIYSCKTIQIPTNKPVIRREYQDQIYVNTDAKYKAILKDVIKRHKKGQPILIGTVSVAESEIISKLLEDANISHYVLNAKNHLLEAQIIAQAGQPGKVTVATSMAGRGTDIILGGNKDEISHILQHQLLQIDDRIGFANLITSQMEIAEAIEIQLDTEQSIVLDVSHNQRVLNALYNEEQFIQAIQDNTSYMWKTLYEMKTSISQQIDMLANNWQNWRDAVFQSGGLCVIGSSRNESRRIDDQLRGRSARQGDPGESIFYMSLQDPWVNVFGKNTIFAQLIKTLPEDEAITSSTITKIFAKAQKNIEAHHFDIRKHTYQYDSVTNEGRQKFIAMRNQILFEEFSVKDVVKQRLYDDLSIVGNDLFLEYLEHKFNKDITVAEILEKSLEEIYQLINEFINSERFFYTEKSQTIDSYLIEQKIELILSQQPQNVWETLHSSFLRILDNNWSSHLEFIDDAQKNVGLRSIIQKNPLYEYKKICFQSFSEMIENLKSKLINEFIIKTS